MWKKLAQALAIALLPSLVKALEELVRADLNGDGAVGFGKES